MLNNDVHDSFYQYDMQRDFDSTSLVKAHQGGGDPIPKAWLEDPYSMLHSMGVGFKHEPTQLTYDMLYLMAKKNHIVGIVHKTIQRKVTNFCKKPKHKYDVGFKIVHKDLKPHQYNRTVRKKVKELEDWVTNMGQEYHPDRPKFRQWVDMVIENRLIYDCITSEIVHRRDGRPHSIWFVPASTMRLSIPKDRKGTPPTYQELQTMIRYVQVDRQRVLQQFTEAQMIWSVANPRTTLYGYGYGFSELEGLILAITGQLWAEQWNLNNFSQGSSVKGIFNLKGNVNREKLEDFRRQWLMQASGVWNAWRQIFLNADGLEFVPLNLSNTEMGYSDWMDFLIQIICLFYQMPPREAGFTLKGGGATGAAETRGQGAAHQRERSTMAEDRYLRPHLLQLTEIINSEKFIGGLTDDFLFEWYGIDRVDEEKDIANRDKELQSFKTLNEVRAEEDMGPLDNGDVPLNPVYTGYIMQIRAQDHTEEEASRVADQEAFEEPEVPEGGGEETTQAEMFANDNQQGGATRQTELEKSFTEYDLYSQIDPSRYEVF